MPLVQWRKELRVDEEIAVKLGCNMIYKECEYCKKEFETYPSQLKRRRFCSKECRNISKKAKVVCICNKTFYISLSEKESRNRKCCSVECRSTLRFLKSHKCDKDGNVLFKKCSICNEWFDISNFWSNTSNKSNVSSSCLICSSKNKKMRLYRLSLDELELLPNSCEVCGSTENLHIDHCHDSDIVRGRLCSNCNTSLGLLKQDEQRIENLLKYVKERCNLTSPLCE